MIEAHALTRRFGTFTAVSQLSLSVPAGSVLALLGPNGAGKTTTVRMLAGLLAPTEGGATVAGYDIRHEPDAVRACIGLMTDVPGLFEQMTMPAYLDFFGNIYGMSSAERFRRINELVELFELTEYRHKKMVGFSKGMKQKVALARALLHEPAVLFLDEPTSGLDPLAARTVRELIVGLKHSNRSIILCTHDLDEAERLADQVAIIRKGKIVACDTPALLRERASGETYVRVEFAQTCPLPLEAIQTINGLNEPRFMSSNAGKGQHDTNGTHPSAVENVLEYRTAQPRVVNPQVLLQLITAGAQVVSVICETPTLEDVYASAMVTGPLQQTLEETPLNEAEISSLTQQER
jgi:ABC-2 type transport system ATP-binding protein